ncbi:hypothetical protein KIN20_031784 [Parelaphostrongylus tenuis]|uniref:Uncharacterized protein n=1 Tax=Parelaphostrongylus tenuis TaxID=148309 RepID=A0AAD5R5X9_PARTN|nr:hypothetical protein KIN20_031784 [Parelaphostrongylus tenuis]
MVCVPCIFIPVLLAIYLYFIQPFILRFLPERWVNFLDPILYPTCPAKPPPVIVNGSHSPVRHTGPESTKDDKKDN